MRPGKRHTTLPKQWFPYFLNELLFAMPNTENLLTKASQTTGISPLDKAPILKRLEHPDTQGVASAAHLITPMAQLPHSVVCYSPIAISKVYIHYSICIYEVYHVRDPLPQSPEKVSLMFGLIFLINRKYHMTHITTTKNQRIDVYASAIKLIKLQFEFICHAKKKAGNSLSIESFH